MKAPDGSLGPPSTGPLEGIRVLDLSTIYAAPITAMLLGDYGADVLTVEHPAGDPARTHGHSVNGHGLRWKLIARNKRVMTLDVRTAAGRDILLRLVAESDVMVENLRPGVLESWDLGIVPRRHGNRSKNSAPRNTYRTRDGHWVAVSSGAA
jgi:crotonobetainyl-CoA:carnitine CoA-transferase CaiB-like acyl-CoA transferase